MKRPSRATPRISRRDSMAYDGKLHSQSQQLVPLPHFGQDEIELRINKCLTKLGKKCIDTK